MPGNRSTCISEQERLQKQYESKHNLQQTPQTNQYTTNWYQVYRVLVSVVAVAGAQHSDGSPMHCSLPGAATSRVKLVWQP